jgi:uncharacterized surface protein with fasciclin (FAS1) repeats
MERKITRKVTVATAALALALTSATASFAGDCNWKKNQEASATYQTAAAPITAVMGATAKHSSATTYSSGTIIDAAVGTPDLSTLTAAVKAAGLVETLQGPGPFTVFAPTNAAFDALPDGTVATLLKPENKAMLTSILTSHVVAGNLSAADIVAAVDANGGKLTVTTVSGAKLKVMKYGDTLKIKDENGGKSKVEIADITKSNGTVHVISGVLLPKSDGES